MFPLLPEVFAKSSSLASYRRTALLILLFAQASVAWSAPMYWDIDGSVAGAGGAAPSGVWDLASTLWSPSSAGDLAPTLWTNTGTEGAVFAAGTDAIGSYIVTVDGTDGAIKLTDLLLEEGGVITLNAQAAGALDFGASTALFQVASGSTLVLNVQINSSAGLSKTGKGMVELNGSVSPGGAYVVNAGELKITDGTSVNATSLTIGGGAGEAATLTLGTGSVFNLGGGISFSNANSPLAGLIQGGTLNLNGSRTVTVQNSTADPDFEIRSIIADGTSASGLTKSGGGTLILSGANTYSGVTTFGANSGATLIQGSEASIAGSSGVVLGASATLSVGSISDNLAADRFGDAATLTLNGSTLNYQGSNFGSQAVHQETVGAVTFGGNARSVLTLTPGTGDEVELRLASLERQGSTTGLVRGDKLGSTTGTAGSTRVLVAEALSLFGEAKTLSSQGLAQILPWLLGAESSTGTGAGFLTYDPVSGLRLLSASEKTEVAGIATGVNVVKTIAGAAAVSSSVDVNSWTNASTGVVTLGSGVTLSITSGGVLFIANGTLSGGAVNLAAYSQGIIHLSLAGNITSAINSVIAGDSGLLYNGSGSGTKTLQLGNSNTFTGGVTVLSGILQVNTAGALNVSGVNTLAVLGGTVRLNGFDATVAGLEGAGTVVNNAAIASTLIVNGGGSFEGSLNDGSTGALSLVKKGSANLILGGNSAYTGSTVVEEGVVHVNQSGANPGTAGQLSGTTSILIKAGAALQINNGNGSGSSNNTNRINDSATITLAGGRLTFNNNGNNITYSEALGALSLTAGANQIATTPSGATGKASLTFSNLNSRAAGSVLTFSGASLGTAVNRVVFTSGVAAGFVGGWATVGNEFAKYVLDVDAATAGDQSSIVAFATTDYFTGAETGWTDTLHAKPAAAQTLAADRNVLTLNLTGGGPISVNLGTHVLNIVSGGLIKQGGAANGTGATNVSVISNGTLTAGGTSSSAELFARVTGANFTISAIIADNPGDGVTPGKVSLVKSGAGKLILNAINTYTGDTYFNEGTIQAAAVNRFGAGVDRKLVFNGGILQFSGVFDPSLLVTQFLGSATFDVQGNNITLAAATGGGGAGDFVKMGAGTLSLASLSDGLDYLGTTTVVEGSLAFTGTGAVHQVRGLILGGGTSVVASVSIGTTNTLNLRGDVTFSTASTVATAFVQTGVLALNGTRVFQVGEEAANAGNLLVATSLLTDGAAPSHLVKTGAGTLQLAGGNQYTGRTEIWNGTIAIDNLTALGAPATGNEALVLGHGATTGNLKYAGTTSALASQEILLNGETGGGGLNVEGSGALEWAGGVSTSQTGAKTFTLGGNSNVLVQNEVSGVISDDLTVQAQVSVAKEGTGYWKLTGQNSYSGTTTVHAGMLQVGEGGAGASLAQARSAGRTGLGRTSVAAGASLSGTGSVQGGLTLSGGEVRPGDASASVGGELGTLWVEGDFTFDSGTLVFQVKSATLNVAALGDGNGESYDAALASLGIDYASELAGPVNLGAAQHDHLEIIGALNSSTEGAKSITVSLAEGYVLEAGDVFNLIDWVNVDEAPAFSAGLAFSLPDLSGDNLKWDTSLFATQGLLIVAQVPEPGRALLLFLGMLGFLLPRSRVQGNSLEDRRAARR